MSHFSYFTHITKNNDLYWCKHHQCSEYGQCSWSLQQDTFKEMFAARRLSDLSAKKIQSAFRSWSARPICPICFNKIISSDSAVPICGHPACFSCLAHSLQFNVNCPICRCELVPERNGLWHIRNRTWAHDHEVQESYHEGYDDGKRVGYREGYMAHATETSPRRRRRRDSFLGSLGCG